MRTKKKSMKTFFFREIIQWKKLKKSKTVLRTTAVISFVLMYIFCLCIIIFVLKYINNERNIQEEETYLFEDEQLSFTFRYPKNWKVETEFSEFRDKTTFDRILLVSDSGNFIFEIYSRLNKYPKLEEECESRGNCPPKRRSFDVYLAELDEFEKLSVAGGKTLLFPKEKGTFISATNSKNLVHATSFSFSNYYIFQLLHDEVTYHTDVFGHDKLGSYMMFSYWKINHNDSEELISQYFNDIKDIISSIQTKGYTEYKRSEEFDLSSAKLNADRRFFNIDLTLPDNYEVEIEESSLSSYPFFNKSYKMYSDDETAIAIIEINTFKGIYCESLDPCSLYSAEYSVYDMEEFYYDDYIPENINTKVGMVNNKSLYRSKEPEDSNEFENKYIYSFSIGSPYFYTSNPSVFVIKDRAYSYTFAGRYLIDKGLNIDEVNSRLKELDQILCSIEFNFNNNTDDLFEFQRKEYEASKVGIKEYGMELLIPEEWEIEYEVNSAEPSGIFDPWAPDLEFNGLFLRIPSLSLTKGDGFVILIEIKQCELQEGEKDCVSEPQHYTKIFGNNDKVFYRNRYLKIENGNLIFEGLSGDNQEITEKIDLEMEGYQLFIEFKYFVPVNLSFDELENDLAEADFIVSSIDL